MESEPNMKSNIKRGRGRPKVFTTEELKNHKSEYMLNKEWFCDICKTGKNYTLAGKSCHNRTKKHIKNTNVINIMEKINNITQRLNT